MKRFSLLIALTCLALAVQTFLLTDYGGTVSAFHAETGVQVRSSDVPTELLRQTDRELLRAGMLLDTAADLTAACENFTA